MGTLEKAPKKDTNSGGKETVYIFSYHKHFVTDNYLPKQICCLKLLVCLPIETVEERWLRSQPELCLIQGLTVTGALLLQACPCRLDPGGGV